MSLDIIIFAVVAAVLVARLKSILGTKHGDERDRPNPLVELEKRKAQEQGKTPAKTAMPAAVPAAMSNAGHTIMVDDAQLNTDKPEVVKAALQDIANVDSQFSVNDFINGARAAFQMITEAFANGDKETLKSLLADDLYQSFESAIKAREANGYIASYELHRIKDSRVADARLAGVMAYVTIDFDVEHTSLIKDKDGKVVEGEADKIVEVHDIWTFARDTRAKDPNWELVSTRIGDA